MQEISKTINRQSNSMSSIVSIVTTVRNLLAESLDLLHMSSDITEVNPNSSNAQSLIA